jgi:RNA polymerase sigma factor (sigma-70 family)
MAPTTPPPLPPCPPPPATPPPGGDADGPIPGVLNGYAMAWIARRVAQRARRRHLQAADAEDAQQAALLAVWRALPHYDPDRALGPPVRSWFCFLGRVVDDALSVFWRKGRRLARVLDHRVDVGRLVASESAGRGRVRARVWGAEDPVRVVEWRERESRLRAAVQQLTEPDRWVMERRLAGDSINAIARRLHVTARVLRRRVRRIHNQLAVLLRCLE